MPRRRILTLPDGVEDDDRWVLYVTTGDAALSLHVRREEIPFGGPTEPFLDVDGLLLHVTWPHARLDDAAALAFARGEPWTNCAAEGCAYVRGAACASTVYTVAAGREMWAAHCTDATDPERPPEALWRAMETWLAEEVAKARATRLDRVPRLVLARALNRIVVPRATREAW